MYEGLSILAVLVILLWFFYILRPSQATRLITCPSCGRFNWKYTEINEKKGHECKSCGYFLEDK